VTAQVQQQALVEQLAVLKHPKHLQMRANIQHMLKAAAESAECAGAYMPAPWVLIGSQKRQQQALESTVGLCLQVHCGLYGDVKWCSVMVYDNLLAAACVTPFVVIVLALVIHSKDQSYAIDAWSVGVATTHCSWSDGAI